METLGQKQRRFSRAIAKFITWAHGCGYEFTFAEAYRSDEQAEIHAMGAQGRAELVRFLMPQFPELARRIANNTGNGIRNSLHESRLAIDLNLFVGNTWISDGKSLHWKALAEKWESMGKDHRAGYRWGDSNHFSIEHEGRK